MARVAGLVRTSLGENASDDSRQIDAITRWAQEHGHVIVEWYIDRGGKRHQSENVRRRPRFIQMMKDAAARKFDIVCVEEHTRFGVKDVYEYGHYIHLLRKYKVQLWEARHNKHLSPPPSQMAEVLESGFLKPTTSRQENVDRSSRTISGKLKHAQRGQWLGGQIMYASQVECRSHGQLLWTVEIRDGVRRAKVKVFSG
jgi:DNA invertase Pin-like site-specific DNA recombinase